MQRLNPDLSLEQAKNHYHCTLKNSHIGKLRTREDKAQATSSRCSQCTVAQQFRWRKRVEEALDILQTKNTGVFKTIVKSFGELIKYFIIRGDETYLISEADGSMKIIGGFGREKHEKKVSDCCASSTMH